MHLVTFAGNWSIEARHWEKRHGRNDDEKSRYDDRDDETAVRGIGASASVGGVRELLFSWLHPW